MTAPNIPLDALASVNSRGAGSPMVAIVEAWLREVLQAIPEGEAWSTRELSAHLGLTDPVDVRRVTRPLYHLRKAGLIADCFTGNPKLRYMGNPLIEWRRPGKEGIF